MSVPFSNEMAAYLWICLENRASVMVLGGTAAGKTTALNALCCLIKPGSKIMTIEETAELNLSSENWVSLIARQSYGLGGSNVGEVALFDLVKTCMRHRPDLMIVGEVRGEEAYVLIPGPSDRSRWHVHHARRKCTVCRQTSNTKTNGYFTSLHPR